MHLMVIMKAFRSTASILQQTSPRSRLNLCRAAHPANATFRPTNHDRHHLQHRTFLGNPFGSSEPQKITATRTLKYPSTKIYSVISDISSYSQYFPFCKQSTVTKYSNPAPNGKAYPEEAKLVIGYNDSIHEEFWSRVYCIPENVVEAVSGNTETTLNRNDISHHNARSIDDQDPSRKNDMVEHLLTRWTLRPVKAEETEVDLAIEVQLANPVYAALSQGVVPKVADKMIEAFEKRLKDVTAKEREG